MKTKIALGVIVGMTGILAFLVFFYPDEQLVDLADLSPTVQNIARENNSYYLVEEARKALIKPKDNTREINDILNFLTEQTANSNKIQTKSYSNEEIDQLLLEEEASIQLLEKAEQLPDYKDPREDIYSTLYLPEIFPLNPSTVYLIRLQFVKGLAEIRKGSPEEGVQAIMQAMELAMKMRKSSLSVVGYVANQAPLIEGKRILSYLEREGMVLSPEMKTRIERLNTPGRKDMVNAIKFEFQIKKNELDEFSRSKNVVIHNHFNLRKNETLNGLADNSRVLVKQMENLDCSQTQTKKIMEGDSNDATWRHYFQKNGVGNSFLLAMKGEFLNMEYLCENEL